MIILEEKNMATFDKIKEMIVDQLDVEADEVTLDANIQEDLGADSLDVVDLVMAIEDEFEVKIEDDVVEGMKTVGDIVKFLDGEKAE
jgi:acyl carrier protein